MNTSHDDHPDPTVNPLVSEMLAVGKNQTTSIEGFVGKVEAGMVRIYANLGLNHYIEVPEAGLVRVVEARDPKEPAVLNDRSGETAPWPRASGTQCCTRCSV